MMARARKKPLKPASATIRALAGNKDSIWSKCPRSLALPLPNFQDHSSPSLRCTRAVTHTLGADFSLPALPKYFSNSCVRAHSKRDPSTPSGMNPMTFKESSNTLAICCRTALATARNALRGNFASAL